MQVLPFTALTAWLLRERAAGASSPFLPFLRLLPDHLPFPYLFSDALLAEMQEELVIMEVSVCRGDWAPGCPAWWVSGWLGDWLAGWPEG